MQINSQLYKLQLFVSYALKLIPVVLGTSQNEKSLDQMSVLLSLHKTFHKCLKQW